MVTRSVPGASVLIFGFSCCFGDPPHAQWVCPLEAVGSTQGMAAATGAGWRLTWVQVRFKPVFSFLQKP